MKAQMIFFPFIKESLFNTFHFESLTQKAVSFSPTQALLPACSGPQPDGLV